jgi:hypothetical protein
MVPVAFDDSRWDYYYYFNSQKFKAPLKRRLTVFFADDKVARYENQGVPTQADLDQLERDLRKAVAENEAKNKKDKHGKSASPASETTPSEPAKAPDPVPPSEPAPAPAGTPSGPT